VEPARLPHEVSSDSVKTLDDILHAKRSEGSGMSESDWVRLVHAVADGDQIALRSIYDRMHRIVFTLMVRMTSNPATAEELTVDVFHDVWRRASSYDPANGPVIGWIMNQARSRAIDRLRFEQRKKRVATGEEPYLSHSYSSPEDALAMEERSRLLREALGVLSPNERQTIEIAYFSELTHQEVAERLKQPLGTVKSRIRSALLKLRDALKGRVR
jgi:RNA polymerase sigma-70 factor (ECF subfamily)